MSDERYGGMGQPDYGGRDDFEVERRAMRHQWREPEQDRDGASEAAGPVPLHLDDFSEGGRLYREMQAIDIEIGVRYEL